MLPIFLINFLRLLFPVNTEEPAAISGILVTLQNFLRKLVLLLLLLLLEQLLALSLVLSFVFGIFVELELFDVDREVTQVVGLALEDHFRVISQQEVPV